MPKIFLIQRIKVVFEESRQIYGSCRIQKKLEREGLFYCQSNVALLMKQMSLKSVLRKKNVVTTDSKHSFPVANNELNREFTSAKLGEKRVSDITYIKVNEDWNYSTTIIDLADRKVVDWSLSDDMTTENTIMKAWFLARQNRNISNNLIFHSDRGVRYASNKMNMLFSFNKKITQSVGLLKNKTVQKMN